MTLAKRVVITGGGGGIGAHMAVHFAQQGAQVAVFDINSQYLFFMQQHLQLKSYIKQMLFIHCDVTNEEMVQKAIRQVVESFGGIDALVNNAGIASPFSRNRQKLEDWTLAEFEKYLRTNLTSAFLMAKETAAELDKSNGCIVNITSTRAYMADPLAEGYAASKGGLISLTTALAASLGHRGIRVNCISPGWIDVRDAVMDKVDRFPEATNVEPYSENLHRQHWVSRMGKGEDIAKMAWFLICDDQGFITGQEFVVDGGMSKKMPLQMGEHHYL